MPVNTSPQFGAVVRRQLSEKVLPLTIRYLVAYQFAEKRSLEKKAGITWTATRFNRLPLPGAPLSEGVPPNGETLTISQVTGVALQWGDKITLTDVAATTTMFDLIQQSKRLLALQIAETRERNIFQTLGSGTQVNYVNTRGSRASLQAGDVMDTTTINRTYADLEDLGAPFYNGQMEPDQSRDIEHGPKASEKGPMRSDHYVAICSGFVEQDLRANPTIVTAWSYSDVTRLYINEIGYWAGIHFTKSNMMPRWVGVAQVNGTAGTAGSLATNSYFIVVTGTDSNNQFSESRIYQVSNSISVTGPTGSVAVTTPATAGFTYSVYIGTTSSPVNLATTSSTWTGQNVTGPLAGQAAQIPPSTAVILTGTGLFQVPPAAPATGITVYPTHIFGKDYFSVLKLEDVQWTSLFEADKSDPLNQVRVVGWKLFEGSVITNQQFGCRIESSVSNTGAFG